MANICDVATNWRVLNQKSFYPDISFLKRQDTNSEENFVFIEAKAIPCMNAMRDWISENLQYGYKMLARYSYELLDYRQEVAFMGLKFFFENDEESMLFLLMFS